MSIVLYGAGLSPYVRKVRLALALKGLDYELIPVIPQSDDKPEEFVKNSPLGKIPLIHIDDFYLADSSAILSYLERSRPDTSLLSDDPKLAAKAMWFEAYASSHMTSVIGGHLFAELILAPAFFNRPSNQEEIELAKTVEIPEIFDYLESVLCADYLLGNTLGHADICVGGSFVTMGHCGVGCDAAKWPKTSAYIDRLMSDPVFSPIISDEQQFLAARGAS
jgi:glutathione S-transferase